MKSSPLALLAIGGTLALGVVAVLLVPTCGPSDDATDSSGAPAPSGPGAKSFRELLGESATPMPEGLQTLRGLPEIAFQSAFGGLPTGGTWREHPCLGDLDGDGRADLIASNREENGLNVWRSMPDDTWEPRMEGIPDNLMYGGSAIGDVDGDGDADFLFAAHKRGLRVFLNDGEMNWTEVEAAADSPFLALDVALGDLNGDEHLDAVTIAQFKNRAGGLGVFLGAGDGTFTFQPQHIARMGRSKMGNQVELHDIDGNGLDDLLLTAEWSCRILTTHLTDSGDIRLDDRSEGLPVPPTNMGNTLRAFIPLDVEGDGVFEVAFAGMCDPGQEVAERNSLGVYRWLEDEGRWEPFGQGLENGFAYVDVLAADLDGDGLDDLITSGPGLGASVYRGGGDGSFEAIGMLAESESGGRGALGDIDGDGRVDVALIVGATKSRPVGAGVRTYLNREEAWER